MFATTKPEDRFKIDPEIVLQQIEEQTGITFTEESRMCRILFVESEGR